MLAWDLAEARAVWHCNTCSGGVAHDVSLLQTTRLGLVREAIRCESMQFDAGDEHMALCKAVVRGRWASTFAAPWVRGRRCGL